MVFERRGRALARMKMPEPIERGRHHEQMHQVTVIGNEVIEPPAADPSGILQRRVADSRRRHDRAWP